MFNKLLKCVHQFKKKNIKHFIPNKGIPEQVGWLASGASGEVDEWLDIGNGVDDDGPKIYVHSRGEGIDSACGSTTGIYVKYDGSGGDGADSACVCSWAEFVGSGECVNIDEGVDRPRPRPLNDLNAIWKKSKGYK